MIPGLPSWLVVGGPHHGVTVEARGADTIELIETSHAAISSGDPLSDVTFAMHIYRLREFHRTAQHPCVPGAAGWITTYRCYLHVDAPGDHPDVVATVAAHAIPVRAPTYQDPWTLPTPAWKLRRQRDEDAAPGHLLYYPPRRVNRLAELFRPYGTEQHTLGTAYLNGKISEADIRARMIACVPACTTTCIRPRGHAGNHHEPEDTP